MTDKRIKLDVSNEMAMLWTFRRMSSLNLPAVDDDKVVASIQSPLAFADGEPDFHFLYGYGVELFASLFVFTPFIQTILFSGVLGCGRLPFIGGRPRTVRLNKIGERKRSIERAGDLCQV